MTGLFNISEALSIAIHLCIRLTRQPGDFCSTRRIADEFGFSVHHVAKVVQKLVRGGVIETVRGIQGGARLAGDPAGITLLAIAGSLDETPPKGCLLSSSICDGGRCLLGRAIRERNEQMRAIMGRTTLREVADSLNPAFNRHTPRRGQRGKQAS